MRQLRATVAIAAAAAMLLMMVAVPAASAGRVTNSISFRYSTYPGTEGHSLWIDLYRSTTTGPATVSVSTTRGTATATTDYTPLVEKAVSFSAGNYASVVLDLPTEGVSGENPETVKLELSSPSPGYRLTKPRTATVTIQEMPAPAAPVLEMPEAANPVVLSWTEDLFQFGAVTFTVSRSTDPPSASVRAFSPIATGLTANTYSDSDVSGGVRYYYRVQAVNPDNAASTMSNEVAVTAAWPAPPDITSVTATAKTTPFVGIQVDWTVSHAVPEGMTVVYRIWRGLTPSNMPVQFTVNSPTMTFSDPSGGTGGLVSGTTYYYRVVAFNADGASGGTVYDAAWTVAP